MVSKRQCAMVFVRKLINLIVQLEERLEIVLYYIMKHRRNPVCNGVVEGTLQHKVCPIFNLFEVKSKRVWC